MKIHPEYITLEDIAHDLRANILGNEKAVRALLAEAKSVDTEQSPADEEQAESHDHLTLAIRDLESARMRLGKFIQYRGDGVSCFDKPGAGA